VVSAFDAHKSLHAPEQIPWYQSLSGEYTFSGFTHTPVGMKVTHTMVTALEKVGLAPTGTVKVHDMLVKTAQDLVRGGKLEIFTPDFFFLARKPQEAREE